MNVSEVRSVWRAAVYNLQKIQIVKVTSIGLLIMLSFMLKASAATLSYWYSDDYQIAFWSSSPNVWYDKIDTSSSFSFLSGLLNGEDEWNDALGTSINISSSYTDAPIKYYGGTKTQIDALGIFDTVPSDASGFTDYADDEWYCEHTYNGIAIACSEQISTIGYIISRSDFSYNNYLKCCTHELGHSMGWRGHSSSTSWIMTQGKSTVTALATGEKNHLAQIY
jgi:hypothetical protein